MLDFDIIMKYDGKNQRDNISANNNKEYVTITCNRHKSKLFSAFGFTGGTIVFQFGSDIGIFRVVEYHDDVHGITFKTYIKHITDDFYYLLLSAPTIDFTSYYLNNKWDETVLRSGKDLLINRWAR